ncbi:LysR family transcriptional regulator [Kitasatospora sp. NPDC002227]|uniref:LysR family transcriptional regulator n=1 Tax=Kitasatospora sp. NPDC002227 TaxID=3154773 RepID=UPI00332258C8
MNLQQLRAFCAVADQLSFTLAARNLHYAQSSVTAQIQRLEESLGVQLFDRSARQIVLTEAGRTLLPFAAHIIRTVETAHAQLAAVKVRTPARGAA